MCEYAGRRLRFSKFFLLNKIKKRRQSDKCKTIKGTDGDINNILKKNKLLSTEIIVVQPAIKRSVKISDKFQEVLASANMYIKNSGLNTDFMYGEANSSYPMFPV